MDIIRCNNQEIMYQEMIDYFLLELNNCLEHKEFVNVAFATGATIEKFMRLLNESNRFLPERINLFVLDEYAGIGWKDQKSCTIDIINNLDRWKDFHSFNYFSKEGYISDIAKYNNYLEMNQLDILVLGIGKDGHVAFLNPPLEKIGSEYYVLNPVKSAEKKVHVEKGWFSDISEVPNYFITLSMYGILKCHTVIAAALYFDKEEILNKMIYSPRFEKSIPACWLLIHNHAVLFHD